MLHTYVLHLHCQIKKQQQRLEMILSKNYKGNDVEYIDVAASEEAKQKMRELSGNPKALPPQIFNGDPYCEVSLHVSVFSEFTRCQCTIYRACWYM